jgi:hypothetical protein
VEIMRKKKIKEYDRYVNHIQLLERKMKFGKRKIFIEDCSRKAILQLSKTKRNS